MLELHSVREVVDVEWEEEHGEVEADVEEVEFDEQRVVMVDHFGRCQVVGGITVVELLEVQGAEVDEAVVEVVVVVQGVGSFELWTSALDQDEKADWDEDQNEAIGVWAKSAGR
ncbi:hypothetical protein N0V85_004242, partial [Neurospora sp. IMI 360204]